MKARRVIRSLDAKLVRFGVVVLLAVSVGVIASTGRHGQSVAVGPLRPLSGTPLASGHANGVKWTFLVESAADLHHRLSRSSEPCLGIETDLPDSGRVRYSGCVDAPPTVHVEFRYLDGDPSTMLFYGFTAAPAATFRIDVGAGTPLSTGALSTKTFPGRWFYAAPLPVGSLPGGFPAHLSVTALAGDGTPLLHSAVELLPPPPPPPGSLLGAPPGTYPIWPVGGTPTSRAYGTATDLARDFAVRALGISDSVVHEPASVSASGIGTITIVLPTLDLPVLTQRRVDGNWEIIQVGDQSRLEGITMLPGGKPGPVMTIHPPVAAASADLTEQAADDTYELHLTAEDLRAGLAHLVANNNPSLSSEAPIRTVLIVYRDHANHAIDALGGQFS